MPTLETGDTTVYYEDTGGDGRAVVLIHGWPLSLESWEDQVPALTGAGYRVVRYDRRGFGRSGKPAGGYDYDTFAADLDALMTTLDLTDATLVGFSMGGGEVARYAGTYGEDRLHSLVLAAAIPPCLLKDEDHPDGGLDLATVHDFQEKIRADREGFLDGFLTGFFSAGGELRVSEQQKAAAAALAAAADLDAADACIGTWVTDFRGDLDRVTVPLLVIHGDGDGIVPVEVSGRRSADQVDGAELVVIENGPHGVNVSQAEEFNRALLDFLAR